MLVLGAQINPGPSSSTRQPAADSMTHSLGGRVRSRTPLACTVADQISLCSQRES
jgi:hypothetical protein